MTLQKFRYYKSRINLIFHLHNHSPANCHRFFSQIKTLHRHNQFFKELRMYYTLFIHESQIFLYIYKLQVRRSINSFTTVHFHGLMDTKKNKVRMTPPNPKNKHPGTNFNCWHWQSQFKILKSNLTIQLSTIIFIKYTTHKLQ